MGGTDAGMVGMDHPQMGGMDQSKMPGMDHSKMHGMDHPSSGPSAAGRPGDPSPVDRTVNVTALDTMRFEPSSLEVKPGETIRFVVTNAGKLPHEFVIGTYEEQSEHAAMMKKMPGMAHQDANSLRLQPGETKTLVWQFDQGGRVQIACHEPGHYEAGMVAQVNVGTAAGNRTAPAGAGGATPSTGSASPNTSEKAPADTGGMKGMDHSGRGK